MTLSAGTHLGPYEILSLLGAGGMGEVYRAKDTRLDRDVAIKVLPEHLSSSPELRQRFEREAKTISALSHPHICALYDVGSQDGIEYLVMELLEGQTLADRLEKGRLPTDQVLKFGIEIASALDKAHHAGIVHRDLKPGNIMLTKSGVKLLDFGLAKLRASAAEKELSQLSALPTELSPSQPLTERGTVMGTFQYMAPEQLEGREADSRTDIFSFGCVLYEMATGKKAFAGKSRASMIAAIMERDPAPISATAPMTPPALDRVVKTCLAKDPEDRFQTAHDVKLQLEWIGEAGSQAGAPAAARRKSRERLAWIGFACAALAAAAFAIAYLGRASKPSPVIRSSIQTPADQFVSFLALSPDGTRLVFSAGAPGEQSSLWVRRLDGAGAERIPGTEDATFPFWSPDGGFVAFFADKKLSKVDLSGGPVVTICEAEMGMGGSWGRDGTILFAPGSTSALFRVPSSGGAPVPVTKLDRKRHETTHRYPDFLPDGRHFLYTAANLAGGGDDSANAIRLGSIEGGDDRVVVPEAANSLYSSGYVLYVQRGNLFALPFDPKGLVALGEALPLAQKVSRGGGGLYYMLFAISDTGLLVLQPDVEIPSRLLWLDRGGKELGSVGEPDLYGDMRLAPDGKKLAVDIFDAPRSRFEIWIMDLSSGAKTRLVSGDSENHDPIWSPDGGRVAFVSVGKDKTPNIWVKAINGGAEEPLLECADQPFPEDWSRDGRFLSFNTVPLTGKRTFQIWVADLASAKKCTALQTSAPHQGGSRISPDGRWLAFSSDESGRAEVYVVPFPTGTGRWQISASGGVQPQWRGDGKELYFESLDSKIMAVPVKGGKIFQAGPPAPLFAIHSAAEGNDFDVSADGKRFLVKSTPGEEYSPPLTLIANWPAALAKKK